VGGRLEDRLDVARHPRSTKLYEVSGRSASAGSLGVPWRFVIGGVLVGGGPDGVTLRAGGLEGRS
jgi:hypothetical protein